MKTISRTDWNALHDDYKLVREDGSRWMLTLIEGEGTCLVEVVLNDPISYPANVHDFAKTLDQVTRQREYLDAAADLRRVIFDSSANTLDRVRADHRYQMAKNGLRDA